jgi:hypothetical protein
MRRYTEKKRSGSRQLLHVTSTLLGRDHQVAVASADDLAYTTGTFTIESNHSAVDKGKFVDVWKSRPTADGKH